MQPLGLRGSEMKTVVVRTDYLVLMVDPSHPPARRQSPATGPGGPARHDAHARGPGRSIIRMRALIFEQDSSAWEWLPFQGGWWSARQAFSREAASAAAPSSAWLSS